MNARKARSYLIDTTMRHSEALRRRLIMGHEYQQYWDDKRTVAVDIRTAVYRQPDLLRPRNVDKRGRISSVCYFTSFERRSCPINVSVRARMRLDHKMAPYGWKFIAPKISRRIPTSAPMMYAAGGSMKTAS